MFRSSFNFKVFLAVLCCVCALAVRPVAADPATVPFVNRTLTLASGATAAYQVFVPRHWNKRRSWPVILFLHGSGERGTDGAAETKNGIRLLIAQDVDHFPCVVVCPQCQPDRRWTEPDMEALGIQALDDCVRDYHGDTSRVYLTGLSLGGYGTWKWAGEHPERWAAIAPCCGGIFYPGNPAQVAAETGADAPDPYPAAAKKVASLPIWVFHGGADPLVPVTESRQMVASLVNLHADVRYNEYPGVGHNSWDHAYAEPDLLPWLLSHKQETK